MTKGKNFAIMGVGGYVAPRHLKAIKDTGNDLVAALDKNDSVGIIDRYFDNVDFFTEFERFDRHVEKLRKEGKSVDYISICTPNYLHDSHIRFALRVGANAICEKPLVLNPWNLDQLKDLEKESGKKIFTVLQLRLHPTIMQLKKEHQDSKEIHDIDLNYITPRGNWYHYSWKGDIEKSGGVATNIGVHFFDMLIWIFGKVKKSEVYYSDKKKMSGFIELEKARIRWFLSIDKNDLPDKKEMKPFRSIKIDGKELEFSDGFTDLHTEVYKNVLEGKGYTIDDVYPSIELVHNIRTSKIINNPDEKRIHPFLKKVLDGQK